MLSRLRDAIFYEGKLCENPPATEQGRSTTSWHTRSNRFPRPYHHLTSNFKLYPISHLKPTGTDTGQLTLPSRIYCPNFSLYHAFWTESCWVKFCPTGAGEYNAVISIFIFLRLLSIFSSAKSWRLESPHLVTVKCGPRLRDWDRSTNTEILHPPCPSGRRLRSTALKDRETGLSANLALTVFKALLKDKLLTWSLFSSKRGLRLWSRNFL
jgi:hypothetical protein